MRNPDELVSSLHLKMLRRRQIHQKRLTSAIGTVSVGLAICLIVLVFGGGTHPVGTAGVYSGAAILFENAGAYVLTALLAFMSGVVITVILLHRRKQEEDRTDIESEQRI